MEDSSEVSVIWAAESAFRRHRGKHSNCIQRAEEVVTRTKIYTKELDMCTRAWFAGTITIAESVTFSRDVLPILQRNCQTCHRPGNIAPMSLLTYENARPWAKAMKAAVSSRKMPPWFADPQYGHFSNDPSLKQSDIDTIAKWAESGAPQGDA